MSRLIAWAFFPEQVLVEKINTKVSGLIQRPLEINMSSTKKKHEKMKSNNRWNVSGNGAPYVS